ncbi:MAG: DNA translocase FtsK [Candidatus Omnitrophica bacterium]|nr:DNA translocase FtsK [Candidatus Omnitrophota bacterium]
MKKEHVYEIIGIFIFSLTALIFLSFVSYHPSDLSFYTSHPNVPPKNLINVFGAYFSGFFFFILGWASYVAPFALFLWGLKFVRRELIRANIVKIIGLLILSLALSSFLAMFLVQDHTIRFRRGGIVGLVFSDFLMHYFGRPGAYVILIMLGLLSLPLLGEILVFPFFARFFADTRGQLNDLLRSLPFFGVKPAPRSAHPAQKLNLSQRANDTASEQKITIPKKEFESEAINIKIAKPKIESQAKEKASLRQTQDENYVLPSLDLLDSPAPVSVRQVKEDLTQQAKLLEDTLNDFGISVRVADIERGPTITRYELEPAPGVKVQRITSLADDIAMTMKVAEVRIVAPIPGKNRVGVEVPNTQTTMVHLKEVLSCDDYKNATSKLTLALGKDTAGKPIVADLGEMPHLLIAGTTGSGKTVCVNGIILSMLFNAAPNDVKFLMVDPKMVELAPYNGLPHLLCPVVTDSKKVATALAWVTNEMDERYQLLAKEGCRNIEAYNQKKQKLPYIIVVIDELADLMMMARDQIESAIARLAQLSRAVGIHLVLATQRPSVDVITGVIKANFPARISFKVASKVDSRTVLDMNGADKLLGRGDLLFLEPGQPKPVRAQSSYVKDSEIERVLEFIKKQADPIYDETILKQQEQAQLGATMEKDDLYDTASRLIIETGQASVSILQRRLRLGYTRAARLIDMMQDEGLVGPYRGSKPREILVDREKWLKEQILKGSVEQPQ